MRRWIDDTIAARGCYFGKQRTEGDFVVAEVLDDGAVGR